jgi:hypothetical protein
MAISTSILITAKIWPEIIFWMINLMKKKYFSNHIVIQMFKIYKLIILELLYCF